MLTGIGSVEASRSEVRVASWPPLANARPGSARRAKFSPGEEGTSGRDESTESRRTVRGIGGVSLTARFAITRRGSMQRSGGLGGHADDDLGSLISSDGGAQAIAGSPPGLFPTDALLGKPAEVVALTRAACVAQVAAPGVALPVVDQEFALYPVAVTSDWTWTTRVSKGRWSST